MTFPEDRADLLNSSEKEKEQLPDGENNRTDDEAVKKNLCDGHDDAETSDDPSKKLISKDGVADDADTPFEINIRRATKEDNDVLKTLTKETYTHEQLLKPSLLLEVTSPRKFPKFAILGYVAFALTNSFLIAFLMVFTLLSIRLGWTYLWIWLWPRLMIHDDNLYGGMYEKFKSSTSSNGESEGKAKSNVRRKRSCLLVAEVKGHGVVGCIGVAPGDCFINPTPTFFQKFAIWILNIAPPVAEFKRLMVKEKFRSKGVASKLLEAAFQFCLTNKYKSVTLSTFLVWYKARRLYAKFGFEESDIQMFDFSFHGKNLHQYK